MSVFLCGQWGPGEASDWLAHLRHALPEETIDDNLAGVDPAGIDIAVVANPPPGSLANLPGLRLIQSLWAGVDRLLADPSLPPRVPVARMVDPAMNAAMAETALWAVLALHRGFFAYAHQQRQGLWQALPQPRAGEWRVAVLGLGQMGGAVVARLQAQGYAVQGWRAADGPAALPPLLAASHTVVNLLPLTPATRGLLDARFFAAMAPGASLVNLARGAHVVEADLLAALEAGQVSHAVLDVFQTEPLPAGHPFWTHARVTVLPHAAAQTDPRSAASVVAANVRALRAGRPLAHQVDRERGY